MSGKEKSAEVKKRCFVISPIGDEGSRERMHADTVLQYIIKPALPDFDVFRADESGRPDMITTRMIDDIFECDLAVADLSFHNPNVFYELGLRHAAAKPIIQILHHEWKVPFDVAVVNTFHFHILDPKTHDKVREQIRSAAAEITKNGYVVSNPVTTTRGVKKLDESSDSRDVLLSQLVGKVSEIEEKLQMMALDYKDSSYERARINLMQDTNTDRLLLGKKLAALFSNIKAATEEMATENEKDKRK